ncbi:Pkinase-domain-containing protein [Wallemia mellicola]|uniref:Pkinase-domain-containing protein n=1 Tax=Wallemia mellicola TaxID=1708541 RepID=A0AB38MPP6_9BASI|nr:Pkinase-domain-containing protein [Wallemia mellicola]TIB83895.1 Pkinase-domain-containing protein [Wallemia mellicola]TIC38235.1 Pkinase-domain-containing protein [Wallemia mellicola]TIC45314.1 Pkinase-domain-containing protein [Wallemia mellicola]TIC61347.1 Pkinase-domain-containing protein [Wallemia mellicola]
MSIYQDEGYEGTQPTQQVTQTQRTSSMPNPNEPGYWGVLMPVGRRDLNSVTFLNEKPLYRFGRHPQENDIILTGKKISNNHCKIYQTGDYDNTDDAGSASTEIVIFLEDTSSNGTYINQVRCGRGVKRRLMPGDEVSFGNPLSNAPGSGDDYRYIFRPRPKKAQSIDENAGGGVFAKYEIGGQNTILYATNSAQIGKGSFATVKKAYERSSGIPRAIKQIAKHKFAMNQKTLKMFEREIGIIKILDHATRFCDIFEDDQVIYLVIEFAAGGDLLDYIINRGGLCECISLFAPTATNKTKAEHETKEIARQMCAAMAYTHEKGITHRDLKPEVSIDLESFVLTYIPKNILLCTKDTESPQIKVTDFGLAKAVDSQTHLKTMCGTPSYLAPEVVLKRAEGYDQAVDSWSTGVIIYAMLTNSSPFDEQEDEPLHERVLKRKVDYNILEKLGLSSNAIDFISKLLVADPKTRMSLKDALNHPWLAGEPLKASRTAPPPPIPVPKFNNRNHVNVVDSTEKDENIKNQIQALQGELKNSSNADSTPYRNGFFQDDDSSPPPKFSIPSSNYSNQNMFSSSPLPSNNKNGQNYNPKSDISCSADMSQLQLQHLSPMLKRKLPAEASDENHDEYGKKKASDNYALRERKQVKH